jgi:peptidyl-prolyl cis-trans isomerase D
MLDVMRKHSRSFIIYIFFGIIIAVFIINFGPQSAGCTASTTYAGKIEGRTISPSLFRYAMSVTGVRSEQMSEPEIFQLRSLVMDQLIAREMLANDALELGFRIPAQEIDDMLVKGRFLALGQPQPLIRNKDGKFDYDLFSRYVRYSWGLNVLTFKEEQERELLAQKMRQFFRTTIKVSENEVYEDFKNKNTQVELTYVRFAPTDFRSQMNDAKIQAYVKTNKKKIQDYYNSNKASFEKRPKQIQLQSIQIKVTDDLSKDAARKKANEILKKIQGGGSFAKLAETDSADLESRTHGGLLGWRNEASPGLDEVADKKVAAIQTNQQPVIIEGKDNFFVVKVIGRRPGGNISLADAEKEIAEDLLKDEESAQLAQKEAEAYLKRAKAGEQLSAMFTVDESKEEGPGSTESPATENKNQTGKKATPKESSNSLRSPLKLATTSSFSRSNHNFIPGIGISEELSKEAFNLKKGEVASKVYKVGQMSYLVAAKERKDATMDEWKKRKEELTEDYLMQKLSREIRSYAYLRCQDAIKDHRIKINNSLVSAPGYTVEKKDTPLPSYVPCATLSERSF